MSQHERDARYRLPEMQSFGKVSRDAGLFCDSLNRTDIYDKTVDVLANFVHPRRSADSQKAKNEKKKKTVGVTTQLLAQRLTHKNLQQKRRVLYRDPRQFLPDRKYCLLGGHQPRIGQIHDIAFGKKDPNSTSTSTSSHTRAPSNQWRRLSWVFQVSEAPPPYLVGRAYYLAIDPWSQEETLCGKT